MPASRLHYPRKRNIALKLNEWDAVVRDITHIQSVLIIDLHHNSGTIQIILLRTSWPRKGQIKHSLEKKPLLRLLRVSICLQIPSIVQQLARQYFEQHVFTCKLNACIIALFVNAILQRRTTENNEVPISASCL